MLTVQAYAVLRFGGPSLLQSLAPIPEADEEMVLSDAEEIETPIPATQNTSVDGSSSQESQNLHSSSSSSQEMSTSHPKGWEAIPKPKGHSGLDYSRWDKVEIDSSDDEEDEDSDEPQYRFRLQTVGVRPVR